MNTEELGQLIESFAPLTLQEEWDNCGYNVNLHNSDVKKVLLSLDVTQAVVDEAAALSCDVIISHHPLLFRKIRTVDSDCFPGDILTNVVRSGISVYCAHTSMDSAACGINTFVASLLGLKDIVPLTQAAEDVYKLSVMVPVQAQDEVRDALFAAGAGRIGCYSDCSFCAPGMGTFRPLPGSDPFIGDTGVLESVDEVRLEVLVPGAVRQEALRAAVNAHPYEVPAVDLYRVATAMPAKDGLGRIGVLKKNIALRDFAALVRRVLQCADVLVAGEPDTQVQRVALCTGAGASEIPAALRAGADVFVTGEVKHNEMTEAALPIVAAGHYDTEKWFCDAMRDALQKAGLEVQYKVDICMSQNMQRPYTVM